MHTKFLASICNLTWRHNSELPYPYCGTNRVSQTEIEDNILVAKKRRQSQDDVDVPSDERFQVFPAQTTQQPTTQVAQGKEDLSPSLSNPKIPAPRQGDSTIHEEDRFKNRKELSCKVCWHFILFLFLLLVLFYMHPTVTVLSVWIDMVNGHKCVLFLLASEFFS